MVADRAIGQNGRVPIDKHVNGDVVDVTFKRMTTKGEQQVTVAGDFNDWSRTTHPMRPVDGGWMVTLTLGAGSSYRFPGAWHMLPVERSAEVAARNVHFADEVDDGPARVPLASAVDHP